MFNIELRIKTNKELFSKSNLKFLSRHLLKCNEIYTVKEIEKIIQRDDKFLLSNSKEGFIKGIECIKKLRKKGIDFDIILEQGYAQVLYDYICANDSINSRVIEDYLIAQKDLIVNLENIVKPNSCKAILFFKKIAKPVIWLLAKMERIYKYLYAPVGLATLIFAIMAYLGSSIPVVEVDDIERNPQIQGLPPLVLVLEYNVVTSEIHSAILPYVSGKQYNIYYTSGDDTRYSIRIFAD